MKRSEYGKILDQQTVIEDDIEKIDARIRRLQALKKKKERQWDVLDYKADRELGLTNGGDE